jgi:hypothetical protein
LWVLVAGKRPGEDVADGAAARLVAARKGREAEKGNGEEETERGRVVGVEQLNAWAMGIFFLSFRFGYPIGNPNTIQQLYQ